MHGYLPLRGFVGKRHYRVYGGPYRECPDFMVGVKLAKEIKAPCDYRVDIEDFHVPTIEQVYVVLHDVLDHVTYGLPVYAGCMGGIGRTGLFLAILAKAWGVKDPVTYVRYFYFESAVETPEQREFVNKFPITPELRRQVFWAKVKMLFTFPDSETDNASLTKVIDKSMSAV